MTFDETVGLTSLLPGYIKLPASITGGDSMQLNLIVDSYRGLPILMVLK